MNPGKVVDGPSPIENLREGRHYKPVDVPTVFDFTRERGLAGAAEMCNGAGVCRKLNTGTMCPSFMATGDEEHSTRGRANALRLVLSGALPAERLTGRQLYDTFDLCLQCKGCKAECPSNVDVAKMKAEFLHHYHSANGTPFGSRLMANVAHLNHLGSFFAPLSNWMLRLPGMGLLMEKLAGIDRRRPMPRFVRQHFAKWYDRHERPKSSPRGPILLLDDCLTSFCEPSVNQAAVEVLEAAGYEVHLANLECCGRAAISKGFLTNARDRAAQRGAAPTVRRSWRPNRRLRAKLPAHADRRIPRSRAGRIGPESCQHASLIETHLVRSGALRGLHRNLPLPRRERAGVRVKRSRKSIFSPSPANSSSTATAIKKPSSA